MSSKQEFLDKLKSALTARGVSDIDAAPYLERFNQFYDRMAADSAQTAAVLEDVDSIADNIFSQISESYSDIDKLAYGTETQNPKPEVESEKPTTEIDISALSDISEYDWDEEPEEVDDNPETESETGDIILPAEEYASLSTSSTRLPDYVEEEQIPNSKLFWILFVVTANIWIPLGLFALALFAAAWLGIAALMVGAIACMVALVAAGSALALVGIIYGIVQLFTSLAVGLYEIGLGIVIIGAVMLSGILIYNFAIRVVPILFSLLYKFFRYCLKKLKQLFNFLRKVCAKI